MDSFRSHASCVSSTKEGYQLLISWLSVVQERNSLGGTSYEPRVLRAILIGRSLAVKAVTAAQLSMAAEGVYSVTLDEAIEAMRLTAADMSVKYKDTSLSVRSCFYSVPSKSSTTFNRVSRY